MSNSSEIGLHDQSSLKLKEKRVKKCKSKFIKPKEAELDDQSVEKLQKS